MVLLKKEKGMSRRARRSWSAIALVSRMCWMALSHPPLVMAVDIGAVFAVPLWTLLAEGPVRAHVMGAK
jgi:hypothetical protein